MKMDGGVVKRKYKYANGNDTGRIYVDGFGGQYFCVKLRTFILGEFMTDLDMVNAHPNILYGICQKYNIKSPLLEQNIKDRSNFLQTFNMDKLSYLIQLNSDNCINNNCPFTDIIYKEFDNIKQEIIKLNDKGDLDIKLNCMIPCFDGVIIEGENFSIKKYQQTLFIPDDFDYEKVVDIEIPKLFFELIKNGGADAVADLFLSQDDNLLYCDDEIYFYNEKTTNKENIST
eukprot:Awhi_evm3s396